MNIPLGAFGTAFNSLLPTISAAPTVVYSTRLRVLPYSGPLFRLVRISDSATLDIYPAADHSADLINTLAGMSVSAWLSPATYCRVDTVYDQMGTGLHANQTNPVVMPLLNLNNLIRARNSLTFDGNQPSGAGYFNIPAGVTGDSTATSVMTVASYESSNAACIMQVGATAGAAGSMSLLLGQGSSSGNQILTGGAGGSFVGLNRTRSQPQAVITTSGLTRLSAYIDQRVNSAAKTGTDGTWSGGIIGKNTTPYPFNGEWYETVIWPIEMTSTEASILKKNSSLTYDSQLINPIQYVLGGNSIVQGTKATLNLNNLRQAEPLFNKRIFCRNQGVFGQTAVQFHSAIASYILQFSTLYTKNLICVIEPTNDIDLQGSGGIVGYGATLWNTYVLPDIQALQAAGFIVLVPDTLPRVWSGNATLQGQKETERLSYNSLVQSNQPTYNYVWMNYAGIPLLSNPSNPTYYADGTHPTTPGYGLMATQVHAPAINANI